MQLLTSQKNLGKFVEALGSEIGTGSIFCLSFSLSNRVICVILDSHPPLNRTSLMDAPFETCKDECQILNSIHSNMSNEYYLHFALCNFHSKAHLKFLFIGFFWENFLILKKGQNHCLSTFLFTFSRMPKLTWLWSFL